MSLAFISQTMTSTALAYSTADCTYGAMNTDMSKMSHENMDSGMMNEIMNHANMMLSDSSQNTTMDCCQEQCKCSISGFASLPLFTINHFNAEVITEKKISQSPLLQQSQVTSSLYRPPIS
jgi:hypothetical protein